MVGTPQIMLTASATGSCGGSPDIRLAHLCGAQMCNMHALSPQQIPVMLLYLPPHAAEVLEKVSHEEMTKLRCTRPC